jgi:hypothetical protein
LREIVTGGQKKLRADFGRMGDVNSCCVPEVPAGLRPGYDKGRMSDIN